MTGLAISTGIAVLALIVLAIGLVIAVLVVILFERVMRPAQEIDRYAHDILEAGVGIATNLDDLDALERTKQLGGAVPGLATRYLEKLQAS